MRNYGEEIFIQRLYFVVIITEKKNKISLHPNNNNNNKKHTVKNREYDLKGGVTKNHCYFVFRKWIHQCLPFMEQYKPASAISLGERNELVESKMIQKK